MSKFRLAVIVGLCRMGDWMCVLAESCRWEVQELQLEDGARPSSWGAGAHAFLRKPEQISKLPGDDY